MPSLDLFDTLARTRQRLLFGSLTGLALLLLGPDGSVLGNPPRMVFLCLLSLYLLACALHWWVLAQREHHWERIERALYPIDMPLIAFGLAVGEAYLAFASPFLAVIALVRGVRYGPRSLAGHSIVGVLLILALWLWVPWWQSNTALVLANLFLLCMLPVQFYRVTARLYAQSSSLQEENLTDPLTRAYNRKAFQIAVWEKLSTREPFVLSFIDLDNFKAVNDSLGHAVGDKLLRRLVSGFHKRLRAEDKVFRWAGDEFVLISPLTNRPGAPDQLGDRIRHAVAEVALNTCPQHKVSASVGIVVVERPDGYNLDGLINLADSLMYQAKRQGKNQAVVAVVGGAELQRESA